jgi:hypothetical protein
MEFQTKFREIFRENGNRHFRLSLGGDDLGGWVKLCFVKVELFSSFSRCP